MYRCPKCKEPLYQSEHSFICAHRHTYDIAKQGYVHLLLGNKKATGDNQEMVQGRTAFLTCGQYDFMRQRIAEIIQKREPDALVDAGCGEGYYTNEIKRVLPACEIYGFDLSKFACKEAAKAKNGVHYAIASVADLPLSDSCADIVLSIFAPVYPNEIRRILKQDGCLIKVGPGPRHLWEMKQVLYQDVYENELEEEALEGLHLVHQEQIEQEIILHGTDVIQGLFTMTPYYYRSPKETSAKLCQMEELRTLAQFRIEIWQK